MARNPHALRPPGGRSRAVRTPHGLPNPTTSYTGPRKTVPAVLHNGSNRRFHRVESAAMAVRLRVREVDVFLRRVKTRIPFRYGKAEVRGQPYAHLRVRCE